MLRYLLEKEFKQIRRDHFMPRIIFLVPLIQLIILPLAANFEMRNINLSIVDHDHSVTSMQLINKVFSSGYFQFVDGLDRYADAIISVEQNKADLIMEIPAGFEKDLGKEGATDIMISANAVNGTKGGLGSSYLASIIQDFNREKGLVPAITERKVTSINLFNPHMSYKMYMVPGIMIFLLTVICGAISSMNIVSEKEKGTIEQINVTPIPKSVFLLSKLIPFWIIGFILLTVAIVVARLIYDLVPVGSFGVIYLFSAIYLIGLTGFGLAISSISSTQQQAMLTTFLFLIVFALLSGLFTPVSSMPEWVQNFTLVNPIRYAVDMIRMVYLKGSGFADLYPHFIAVVCFAVVCNVLAIFSYRKNS